MSLFNQLKKKIKNIDGTHKLYDNFLKILFKSKFIPNEIPTKILYSVSQQKKLNLKEPRDLNQKIQWLKLYHHQDELYTQCTDKYLVRDYVKGKGLNYILNDLYGVYDNLSEVNYNELPKSFVMKGTRNGILLCEDKKDKDLDIKLDKFDEELRKSDYGISTGEFHYQNIDQKIVIEKYLFVKNEEIPLDYKIFSFNGEPSVITVYKRDENKDIEKRFVFDFNWNPKPEYMNKKYITDYKIFKKPENLEEMYLVAKKLSKPFLFVRVDLYNIDERIIFGELTFSPTGGIGKTYSEKGLIEFGDQIKLPH